METGKPSLPLKACCLDSCEGSGLKLAWILELICDFLLLSAADRPEKSDSIHSISFAFIMPHKRMNKA
jgi:hypothetical protein